MIDLKTTYLGIELKNPIIVGACNLVENLNNLKKMEQAGAAAIVYRSLFEEQIQLEAMQMHQEMEEYNERHAEMVRLFPTMEHAGPSEYLVNLSRARKAVSIPLFASLNAVLDESWVEYAIEIEKTGVDGLELNFYHIPVDFDKPAAEIIEEQVNVVRKVKDAVKIPVSVKLSPFYTNPLAVIRQMEKAGANGFVLFNRLFQPEINIHEEKDFFPYNLSHSEDKRLSLRFAGLLYGNTEASVCSNTGIIDGNDVISLLLAGADCVQIVSTLYKNHIEHITTMIREIEDWMEEKKYDSIGDFKGKLSLKNSTDPFAYRRAQYVDILLKSEEIFRKYPMV